MKIAFCVEEESNDALVSVRFGRAGIFAIYDTDSKKWQYIPNTQDTQAVQGAGLQASQQVIDSGAETLIALNVGPKAMAALTGNGIKVYKAVEGKEIRELINDYQANKLEMIKEANVDGHWV